MNIKLLVAGNLMTLCAVALDVHALNAFRELESAQASMVQTVAGESESVSDSAGKFADATGSAPTLPGAVSMPILSGPLSGLSLSRPSNAAGSEIATPGSNSHEYKYYRGFEYGFRSVEAFPSRLIETGPWQAIFGIILGIALLPVALIGGVVTEVSDSEGWVKEKPTP